MRAEPSIARLAVGLTILSLVFFVVERLLGNGRGRPVLRRGVLTDAAYWILTPLVAKPLIRLSILLPIGLLVAAGVASVEEFRSRAYTGFGPLSRQPLWLQSLEIYLLVDLLSYWNHRLFHRGRWWPFHAVHHSSAELDWMSSIRVHPVNELVGTLCRATPVLLLGLNPVVTASTAPVLMLYAVLLHANVDWDFGPLRGVIASPVFHRWHHSRDPAAIDKNFAGLFPVWDILFGTYYMPRDRVPGNFGIHEPMPEGYFAQLVHPFAAWRGGRCKAALAVQSPIPAARRAASHISVTLALGLTALAASAVAQPPPPAPAGGQWTPDRLFSTWDKDGDGRLTAAEVPKPDLFRMLDRNCDGAVTRDEVAGMGAEGTAAPRVMAPAMPRKPGAPADAAAGLGAAAKWKGTGVSTGAPLPPAGTFKPRTHGPELAKAGLEPDAIARLDVEMQRHVAAKNVAGISAMIGKNGVRGYFETFGMADIERGRVMEDDAIFRLMSHSSGLGYGGGQSAAAMAYQAMTKPGATLEEFSAAVAKEPLMFEPGTNYNYGMGLDILGRYLEALTGRPLDVILKERLFGPLGMPDTDFHVPAGKVERLCQIYGQPSPGVLVPGSDRTTVSNKPTLCLGGHGLFGTIGDYERLCRMMLGRGELDGVRVLKPETVDLIFENHLRHSTMKYGLGGIVNGAGSYGWGGADGTQFVIDRKNNSFTLFMVQTQHYKAPTYPAFLALANEACGLAATAPQRAIP